jgi:phytoene synthase
VTSSGEKSSNFYLGFFFLSKEQREALSAVYAYCRLIDDVVDSQELPKDESRAQLRFWREEVERLYEGKPTHPISRRLAGPIKSFGLEKKDFLEMIRGCEMDLEQTTYKTFADLEPYLQGVAVSVGRLSLRIFKPSFTPAEKLALFARYFGYAFQLTNIARDVGADLELGRVYLPEEEVAQAGYSREKLLRREHDAAFDALMQRQYARAKDYYAKARELVDARDRKALLPAEIMAHVYEGVLDEVRAQRYRVLFQKTSLPAWRKLKLAARAWLYCHAL